MRIELKTPIIYLITNGESTNQTFEVDCKRILELVESAISAGVSLIQLREKNLSALALFELTRRSALLTKSSSTKLLVNDRADIAKAAGADGVHLTRRSLETRIIRDAFGDKLLIGVSTHSIDEVRDARGNGSDFVVYGSVFETPSKSGYGPPMGVDRLRLVTQAVNPFPVVALGGVTRDNARLAFEAGATGIAAIRSLGDLNTLNDTVQDLQDQAKAFTVK